MPGPLQNGNNQGAFSLINGLDGVEANGGPAGADDYAKSLSFANTQITDTLLTAGVYSQVRGDVKSPNYTAHSRANGLSWCQQNYNYDSDQGHWRWLWEVNLESLQSSNQAWLPLCNHYVEVRLGPYNNIKAEWNADKQEWHVHGTARTANDTSVTVDYRTDELGASFAFWKRTIGREVYSAFATWGYQVGEWFPDATGQAWQDGYGHVAETAGPPYAENYSGEARLELKQVLPI